MLCVWRGRCMAMNYSRRLRGLALACAPNSVPCVASASPRSWVAPDSNLTLAQLTSEQSLSEIAGWAAGLGMSKSSLVRWQPEAAVVAGAAAAAAAGGGAGSAALPAAAASQAAGQAKAAGAGAGSVGAGGAVAAAAAASKATKTAVKHRRRLSAAPGKAGAAAVVAALGSHGGTGGSAAAAAGLAPGAEAEAGRYVSTGVVERAQSHGLQVHIYTLRPEPQFFLPQLAQHVRGRDTPPPLPGANVTVADEYELFLQEVVAVDGLFADHMPSLQQWLRQHHLGRSPLLAQLSQQQVAEAGGAGRGGGGGSVGGKGGRGQKGKRGGSGGQQGQQGRGRAGGKEVETRPAQLGSGGGADAVEMVDAEAKAGGSGGGRREARADRGGQGGRERGAYAGAGGAAGTAGGREHRARVLDSGLRCEPFRGAGNRQFQGR